MDSTNLYTPPKTAVRDVTDVMGHTITANILAAMRKTRPWVLFLAILGFIGAFFTAIAGIMLMATMTYLGQATGVEGAFLGQTPGGMTTIIGMGAIYIVIAIIYIIISVYLLRYASAIKRLNGSHNVRDLEDALNAQASFWKTVGIMALTSIIAMLVLWVIGIGAAVSQMPVS